MDKIILKICNTHIYFFLNFLKFLRGFDIYLLCGCKLQCDVV